MKGIQAHFRLAWPGFTLDVNLDLPGQGVTALFGHSGSPGHPVRAAGPILQPAHPLGAEPGHPPVRGLPGDPHLFRHVRDRAAISEDPLDQQAATMKRQTGISVTHGDLRLW